MQGFKYGDRVPLNIGWWGYGNYTHNYWDFMNDYWDHQATMAPAYDWTSHFENPYYDYDNAWGSYSTPGKKGENAGYTSRGNPHEYWKKYDDPYDNRPKPLLSQEHNALNHTSFVKEAKPAVPLTKEQLKAQVKKEMDELMQL